jgi:hypothetical protein
VQVSLRYLTGGRPAVAYRDTVGCQMKYAVQNAGVWSTPALIEKISDTGVACTSTHGEIAIVPVNVATAPNTIAVGYHSHRTSADGCGSGTAAPCFRYAACAGGDCQTGADGSGTTATWTVRNLDTSDTTCTGGLTGTHQNIGHYVALANDNTTNNRPVAAYASETPGNNGSCSGATVNSLIYSSCSTDDCAAARAAWNTRLVLEAGAGATDTGLWNSIDVVSIPPAVAGGAYTNLVGIAYENTGTAQVKLATCATVCAGTTPCGPSCNTLAKWSFAVVDTLKAGSYFPNLQFDPQGNAHITYIDSGNTTLRYAIRQGSAAASPFHYFEVDHGVDDGHSSFILTPFGSTHVSYALTTGLKFYPFGD